MRARLVLIPAILALFASCQKEAVKPAAPATPPSAAVSTAAAAPAAPALSPEAEVTKWRAERLARLTKEDGWLSLTGLLWLNEGKNDVVLPSKPPVTIQASLNAGKVTLEPAPGLAIDGKPVTAPVVLVDDNDEVKGPTVVTLGSLRFNVIRRDPKFAFRVKDPNSAARKHFKGIDNFPFDPKWRIDGRFEPFTPVRKMSITNVLGMTGDEVAPGTIVFNVDGKAYRVDPILEKGETDYFVIFKDETSGHETYAAARYLYVTPPGPDGKVVIDFNKAYNPPCSFTPFATCPLPPAQNKLPFRIEAGEKKYAGHA